MHKSTQGMKTFFIIWLGQLGSMIGSGLIGFALAVWIFEQTGQATPFALTGLFAILPRVILSPVAGALSDRWNRKKIMLISDSLSGVITFATAIFLLSGRMEVWTVYLISFLGSIFAAFQQPAYSASIVMLVPKDQLSRANSMVQMGSAIESILTPLLAGILVTSVGMKAIILIDVVTYLFAILTLVIVKIPQPERKDFDPDDKHAIIKDVIFGWEYLAERKGLLGLLFYFAVVNFTANLSSAMIGPLVLSFGTATQFGTAQTVAGVGMLAGSLLMSIWGGPKKNLIGAVIGFIALASVGFCVAGWQPSLIFVSAGLFILMFFIPFSTGPSSAIFAKKVAPEVQGRVFATRNMISLSMMPLAYILSGVLADQAFNPWLVEGGALADTFIGRWIGVGSGRGIGLMMICSGFVLMAASAAAYLNPRVRQIETEIPDVLLESPPDPSKEELPQEGELPDLPGSSIPREPVE
ncbi:MAG: MFS transporter [Chloroflexi bacterium]|nr:MFS transporter [Chloroflexota bacterium]